MDQLALQDMTIFTLFNETLSHKLILVSFPVIFLPEFSPKRNSKKVYILSYPAEQPLMYGTADHFGVIANC